MKEIVKINIQEIRNSDIDYSWIIEKVTNLMKVEYPDFLEWFKTKVIPGIENNTRNIIVLYRDDRIIGFVNLTKKQQEKKISNIYLKSIIHYDKYWNLMIDEAIKWLEDEYPVVIVSKKQLYKCFGLAMDKNWYLTDETKNHDYVLNRYDEFEFIGKALKKRRPN